MHLLKSTKSYEKELKKFLKSYPDLIIKFCKTIKLLGDNPYHPSLRLHKLKGNLQDLYSVSINMQYLIMLDFIIRDDEVILLDIGAHTQLYGSWLVIEIVPLIQT